MRHSTLFSNSGLLTCLVLAASCANASAAAVTADASASGTVASSDGTPIASAEIRLAGAGPVRVARSDRSGAFRFESLASGTFTLAVSAPGYTAVVARTIEIAPRANTQIDLRLVRAQASSLTVIGGVRTNGSQAISTAAAPTLDISTQPYAQQGVTRVSDILDDQLATTVFPVVGGGLNAPAAVSVRGPDPNETLVDIDGHQVNNGSTGDFDLSLLDPADLTSAQVVYGIAPSSLYGPNTLGGALNVRTLEPTAQTHVLERITGGTFDTFGETLQATGTFGGVAETAADRLGYAFSFHRLTSGGDENGAGFPVTTSAAETDRDRLATVGDSLDASSTIAKLRYSLDRGAGFVGISLRDQAVQRDLSSALSSSEAGAGPGGTTAYANFSGSSSRSHDSAYDVDLQLPLGSLDASGASATSMTFRHQTSLSSQSVEGPGAETSEYLYDDRDAIGDDTLEFDHRLPRGELSARLALTTESLRTTFTDAAATQQVLGQTQRSLGLLYDAEPTPHLHYSFAGYYSDYSTFRTSVDPRFGFVWTPKAASALRFSVGSTFQSPPLPSFVVPAALPPPVDGYVSIGNPHETAQHATSYDLGYEHRFRVNGSDLHLATDVYRVDLHNGLQTFLTKTECVPGVDYGTNPPCLSFPVNDAQEVYQGFDLKADFALTAHDSLSLGYDIDSVYVQTAPFAEIEETIPYEQGFGVPLHKITADFEHRTAAGIAYYAGMLYEGSYDATGLAPYATLRAGATLRLPHVDVGLYGTNLGDVYDFKHQRVGGGIPYGGLAGTIPTNAIPLAPRTITLSIAHRT